MQITASARIKHWFGIHTYVETLYPVFREPTLSLKELYALQVRNECWVCGRLA